MKDFAGTPGTVTGLALRISQCVFASGAIAFMVSTSGFYYITAFCYLVASMGLQAAWSFGMALLDTYALITNRALRSPAVISLFVVGDWVTGTLSLSAVSACAGIVILYVHDAGICKGVNECTKFQLSVVLAFLSWSGVRSSHQAMASDQGEFSSSMKSFCSKFRPHIYMVLAQVGYTLLYFITEASFDHGMNPHVYITYRNIVAGIVMFPFAYFLERKLRPKLTLALFGEIFLLSLLGVSLTLNMYFASLEYTSPTFVASMVNTVPSLTFLIAVVLRLERLDMSKTRGVAKLIGTLISLAGVLTMTLYKGSLIRNVGHPLLRVQGSSDIHESWVKGSVLTVASCITWSIWYIMQAYTLKRYPAQLSLTTWMCVLGAAQSAVYTVCVEHTAAAWTIGFNIDLWSTVYGGVVVSGLIVFVQLWCIEEKGPVFMTMFNPLSTLLVAVLAYFAFGEKLHVGSLLGGAILILGLYLLLWGKEGDESDPVKSEESKSVYDDSSPVKRQEAKEEP